MSSSALRADDSRLTWCFLTFRRASEAPYPVDAWEVGAGNRERLVTVTSDSIDHSDEEPRLLDDLQRELDKYRHSIPLLLVTSDTALQTLRSRLFARCEETEPTLRGLDYLPVLDQLHRWFDITSLPEEKRPALIEVEGHPTTQFVSIESLWECWRSIVPLIPPETLRRSDSA